MHTVLVTCTLPRAIPRAELLERFEHSEARFCALPSPIRKHFCCDEATPSGHSAYLWHSEADACAFFGAAFMDHFVQQFGCMPSLAHVDTLMVVENEHGNKVFGRGAVQGNSNEIVPAPSSCQKYANPRATEAALNRSSRRPPTGSFRW
ncbi:MAG: hypothetical protein Kow0013_08140 [Pararhodobacter sp.]